VRSKTNLRRSFIVCLAAIAGWSGYAGAEWQQSFEVIDRFAVAEARQGVGVDAKHFYAVDNRSIGKYDKASGKLVRRWDAPDDAAIIHLNSAVVVDGKLYCAHSNYPHVPMVSSIEVFDPETLEHLESQSIETAEGSITWVDRLGNTWWGALANYEGRGAQPGRGPSATRLVRFDRSWAVAAQYAFPPEVISRFGTRSNSGGAWGADGLLYITGHDGPEIFVLRVPAEGSVLDLVEVVSAAIDGQGIAWDRSVPGVLYGIVKESRTVVALRDTRTQRTDRLDQTSIEATSGK